MRRFLMFVFLGITSLGLVAPPAVANGKPTKERYASTGFYTSWRQRERISSDAFYRINWYVSVYESQEGQRKFFSSYASRYVSKCKVESGGHTREEKTQPPGTRGSAVPPPRRTRDRLPGARFRPGPPGND